jgi:alkaline phosphatase D
LLLGTGRLGEDWRRRALIHSRPAADGGVAIGLGGDGTLAIRDFQTNVRAGSWAVTGPLAEGEFSVLASNRPERMRPRSLRAELVLTVQVRVRDGVADVLSVVREAGDDEEIRLRQDLPAEWLEGGIGLISHLGARESSGGFAFAGLELWGSKGRVEDSRHFGPVLGTLYTVDDGVLKLTAQMPPLGEGDVQLGVLQVMRGGEWRDAAAAVIDRDSYTLRFRVRGWDAKESVPYRVRYRLRSGVSEYRDCEYAGTIRYADPDQDELVLAAFSCVKHYTGGLQWNADRIWFPHEDVVERVLEHDPDLLFFAGDQIYEGDITGAQRKPEQLARLDYLDKWYRWVWSFGELTRHRPSVVIPDDHDVYHGNLWGAGGRKARRQDDGGYTMPARFVRMVERTQTSHLPDPFDPAPVQQGIGVYYTSLDWGGVSFAVIEDRKFKDSATPTVPKGKFVNGWSQAEGFDPAKDADVPGAVLLGERQHRFLEHWAQDWKRGVMMKAVLSQTIFHNLATLPADGKNGSASVRQPYTKPGEYPKGWKMAADTDSNGWPQSARNEALSIIRRAFAVHIAGDQHLPSLSRYGVNGWDNAGWAFCVPAVGNTWPRRFWPPESAKVSIEEVLGLSGSIYDDGLDDPWADLRWRGYYRDGFGNPMFVQAVANPMKSGKQPEALHDRMPGYGIVRFDKRALKLRFECWPRWARKADGDAAQYPGWPYEVDVASNWSSTGSWARPAEQTNRKIVPAPRGSFLPCIDFGDMQRPLLQVFDSATNRHVYSVRILAKGRVVPWVPRPGTYDVWIGEPGTERRGIFTGLPSAALMDWEPKLRLRTKAAARDR